MNDEEAVVISPKRYREIEVIDDDSFSYEDYEVVRGEFFAHTYEPMISFYQNKVFVNSACLRRFGDTEYVQILVNPEEKKMAVKPSSEEDKDSFKWITGRSKRTPRHIRCDLFFAKVFTLMGWNPDFKYKLLGKLIRSRSEYLFVFDMNTPEIFVRRSDVESGKIKLSRNATYPEEWQNQFGLPAKEHQNTVSINIFDGYTVFGISKTNNEKPVESEVRNDDTESN